MNELSASSPNVVIFLHGLTRQETQVLLLCIPGHAIKIIADKLGISNNTVRTHRGHLLLKWRAIDETAIGGKAGFWHMLREVETYLNQKSS